MIDYSAYLPVLIFMGLAVGLSIVMVFLAWLRSRSNPYRDKNAQYECGFDAFSPPDGTMHKVHIQFHLVAILFIIFDLEIALLFPWALSLKNIGLFGFWSMAFFLFVLAIGFIYEWRKGALEWE
ncbi:MAG: NADH-quinone oxidoreductase subunit A [Alphaproteobacteria bacterium]|nr:NADH-quinone oxidoreductase subunit A [Alphaproteobacteria bacterium]